jgi:hypothetical protein
MWMWMGCVCVCARVFVRRDKGIKTQRTYVEVESDRWCGGADLVDPDGVTHVRNVSFADIVLVEKSKRSSGCPIAWDLENSLVNGTPHHADDALRVAAIVPSVGVNRARGICVPAKQEEIQCVWDARELNSCVDVGSPHRVAQRGQPINVTWCQRKSTDSLNNTLKQVRVQAQGLAQATCRWLGRAKDTDDGLLGEVGWVRCRHEHRRRPWQARRVDGAG